MSTSISRQIQSSVYRPTQSTTSSTAVESKPVEATRALGSSSSAAVVADSVKMDCKPAAAAAVSTDDSIAQAMKLRDSSRSRTIGNGTALSDLTAVSGPSLEGLSSAQLKAKFVEGWDGMQAAAAKLTAAQASGDSGKVLQAKIEAKAAIAEMKDVVSYATDKLKAGGPAPVDKDFVVTAFMAIGIPESGPCALPAQVQAEGKDLAKAAMDFMYAVPASGHPNLMPQIPNEKISPKLDELGAQGVLEYTKTAYTRTCEVMGNLGRDVPMFKPITQPYVQNMDLNWLSSAPSMSTLDAATQDALHQARDKSLAEMAKPPQG